MYLIKQIKERLSPPFFISFLNKTTVLLFSILGTGYLNAQELKEYYVEVIVFEQLEVSQDEDFSPVALDFGALNLITLLEKQSSEINTDAIERSFEVEVKEELIKNLDFTELTLEQNTQLQAEPEKKKPLLSTDKWFEKNDQLKVLNNIYRRLDRRKEYKVLHKFSWMQPALAEKETPYIHETFDAHGLLVRLYQSRYLHLDLIGYMNGALESSKNIEQIESIKFLALQDSIPEDVDLIKIPVSSQILYMEELPKLEDELSIASEPMTSLVTEGMVEYVLREDRRIFKNESHYFDHPKIGIIVSVYDSSL